MSGRITFGDLLDTARESLRQAAEVTTRPNSAELLEVISGMSRLLTALDGYLKDIAHREARSRDRNAAPSPEAAACEEARHAAAEAIQQLLAVDDRPRRGLVSKRGRRLERAALAVMAGRDLLHSHVAARPRELRTRDSGWASAMAAPGTRRALMDEVGALARQVATAGIRIAAVPGQSWHSAIRERQAINAACGSLREMHAALQPVAGRAAVLASDRELLRAVAPDFAPTRLVPEGSEPVPVLRDGVIGAAERVRHTVRKAAGRASWLPEGNVDSLRDVAAATVAASHHCAVLLRGLGSSPSTPDREQDWPGAVAATERARDAWLQVARSLDLLTSDVRGHPAPEVTDVRDLALWTGRLVYADPQWTLASGPRHPERPAGDLAATPEDAIQVTAAVHHATDAIYRVARVQRQLAWSAARGGRFLVPTRTLPDDYDVPRPYAYAPPEVTDLITSAYQEAHVASVEAVSKMAEIAEAGHVPSRVLARISGKSAPRRTGRGSRPDQHAALIAAGAPPELVGPAELRLRSLGVTDPQYLVRAKAVDRAGEQVLYDAFVNRIRERIRPEPGPLTDAETARMHAQQVRAALAEPRKARPENVLEREPGG